MSESQLIIDKEKIITADDLLMCLPHYNIFDISKMSKEEVDAVQPTEIPFTTKELVDLIKKGGGLFTKDFPPTVMDGRKIYWVKTSDGELWNGAYENGEPGSRIVFGKELFT
ncbi:MAG: hypothetical protein WCT11_03270 [Candidatus Magasanikbacteria bacterium]